MTTPKNFKDYRIVKKLDWVRGKGFWGFLKAKNLSKFSWCETLVIETKCEICGKTHTEEIPRYTRGFYAPEDYIKNSFYVSSRYKPIQYRICLSHKDKEIEKFLDER